MLFRKDFHETGELREQIELYIEDCDKLIEEENTELHFEEFEEPTEEEQAYLAERIQRIILKLDEIDALISDAASGWRLNRMGKVDLTILRLAVFEMKFDEEIPVKVAINEAVELAKKFGGEESPSFINGVLAKLA
ncbi:MAG: hypothetical protein K0S47_3349 [Herbinix sp.]|jgi:N utilization substance protein B|nr:hypothetical protein [Herbinix sp.]